MCRFTKSLCIISKSFRLVRLLVTYTLSRVQSVGDARLPILWYINILRWHVTYNTWRILFVKVDIAEVDVYMFVVDFKRPSFELDPLAQPCLIVLILKAALQGRVAQLPTHVAGPSTTGPAELSGWVLYSITMLWQKTFAWTENQGPRVQGPVRYPLTYRFTPHLILGSMAQYAIH